ncbi:MAG TPA: hypothetical protein VGB83_10565 [Actinomycetota bacterium]
MIAFIVWLVLLALLIATHYVVTNYGSQFHATLSRMLIDYRIENEKQRHDRITTKVRLRMAEIDRETFHRIADARRSHGKDAP